MNSDTAAMATAMTFSPTPVSAWRKKSERPLVSSSSLLRQYEGSKSLKNLCGRC